MKVKYGQETREWDEDRHTELLCKGFKIANSSRLEHKIVKVLQETDDLRIFSFNFMTGDFIMDGQKIQIASNKGFFYLKNYIDHEGEKIRKEIEDQSRRILRLKRKYSVSLDSASGLTEFLHDLENFKKEEKL